MSVTGGPHAITGAAAGGTCVASVAVQWQYSGFLLYYTKFRCDDDDDDIALTSNEFGCMALLPK